MSELFADVGPPATPGKTKVCLATVSYDRPAVGYTASLQTSRRALAEAGIESDWLLLHGNCHVDDARNAMVAHFLETDCTDLVFLDADVWWPPEALVELCTVDAVEIIGGVYPHRADSFGESEAMPVRMMKGIITPDDEGRMLVEGLPTGFMRIAREVLEKMAAEATKYHKGLNVQEHPLLFERTIINGIGRMGGDIHFCKKWIDMGGKIEALPNLRLGHSYTDIRRDSLAASLRRQQGLTLEYLVNRFRQGEQSEEDYYEALTYWNNNWAAGADVLAQSVELARSSALPIIEAGSGISTVLMAAASEQTVYCLEHDRPWAERLRQMANKVRLRVGLCYAPLRDGWYDLTEFDDLPERFGLGLCDGPPRWAGTRLRFFEVLGDRCDVILVDDADDRRYASAIEAWAAQRGRKVHRLSPRSLIVGRVAEQEMAA